MSGPIFTAEQQAALQNWARRYPRPQMGLIEALRDVQRWHGWISPEAEVFIADLFKVPFNQVHGIVTFYPYFTTKPAGKHRVCICRNLSCHLRGAPRLLEHLKDRLGTEEGEVTPDGLFSYEAVECLGACDHAPAMMIDDDLHGDLTAAKVDEVLAKYA